MILTVKIDEQELIEKELSAIVQAKFKALIEDAFTNVELPRIKDKVLSALDKKTTEFVEQLIDVLFDEDDEIWSSAKETITNVIIEKWNLQRS